jgi:hypothetical protein
MSSYDNDENIKSIWCRSYYGMNLNKQGYKITEIYPCKFGSKCRGAHTCDDIIEKNSIKKWKQCDKSHINILELMEQVIEILEKNKEMIQNTKYRVKILNINKMKIDELFAFWYEVFYYHHRISKELPTKKAWTNTKSKPAPIEGYNYKDDVPNFYIENDDLWSIERMMHMCPKFISLDRNIRVSVKNICIGDINCKEGVHDNNDLMCMDNLITGTCNCVSADIYEQNKKKIIDEINSINNQLNPGDDEEGFTINISKKKKDELSSLLLIKKKELSEMKRMVHITEKGVIPLNIRIEIKNVANPKPSEEVQVKKTNKIVKPKF